MNGWTIAICIGLFVVLVMVWPDLWALGPDRVLRDWFRLRSRAEQARAAAGRDAAQQHFDAGMQLLKEKQWAGAISAFDRALGLPHHRGVRLQSKTREVSPSQEVSILLYRGFALEQLGELEKALTAYRGCQALYGRLHEDLQYVAAVRQGLLLARLGRAQEAEQHLRQTIAALQRVPDTPLAGSVSRLQIEALEILVGLQHRARDNARALEYAQEGLQAARRLRDATAQANFLRAAGDALQALRRSDEALHSYEQSLDLYRRMGETGSETMVKRDIALLYQLEGQWDKALAWLQACLVEEEREQNKQGQARLCYDIACMHIDQGNLQDASKLLQQSISLFRQTEDHQGIDQVGRTMMGLSILVHRRITANQMTFRDVERGSKSQKDKS